MRHTFACVLLFSLTACGLPSVENEPDEEKKQVLVEPTREQKLSLLGYLIAETYNTLYNANFVGRSGMISEETETCPVGGQVTFNGSIGVTQTAGGGSSTAPDITYKFQDCEVAGALGTIVYAADGTTATGRVHGTWVLQGGYRQSQTSTMSGSAHLKGYVVIAQKQYPIDEPACEFSVTQVLSDPQNDKWTTSGRVCGVDIND